MLWQNIPFRYYIINPLYTIIFMNRKSNKDKIYKIYNAIKKLDDTGNIYEILRTMDIPKTMNSNGIFVNLKCLGEDQIKVLYDIVQSIKCPQIPEQSLQSYQPVSCEIKT